MSGNRVKGPGDSLERRSVLRSLFTGLGALVTGIIVGPTASARPQDCCQLCTREKLCTDTELAVCQSGAGSCVWSWLCCYENVVVCSCSECHSSSGYCGPGCVNINCSHVVCWPQYC